MADILNSIYLDGSNSSNSLIFANEISGGISSTESFVGGVTGDNSSEKLKNKISSLVKYNVPEFIRSDYNLFVYFIEAYYKFLEQDYNSQEIIQNIQSYADIDRTAPSFVYYFLQNYAKDLPLDILADKKLLIKRINDLYTSKGSALSFDILFRILFNTTVEIKHPYDNTLIASGGTWTQKYALGMKVISGDVIKIVNRYLTYSTPGGAKFETPILSFKTFPNDDIEISLDQNNLSSEYRIGDSAYVYNVLGEVIFEGKILSTLTNASILQAGQGFKPGQIFTVNFGANTGVLVKVTQTSASGGIQKLKFVNYGYNYPDVLTFNLNKDTTNVSKKDATTSSTRGTTDSVEISLLSQTPGNVTLKGNITISTFTNRIDGFGGTEFNSNIKPGDYVTIVSNVYTVQNVTSNTQFYITTVGKTSASSGNVQLKGNVSLSNNTDVVLGFGGTEFNSNLKSGDYVTILSNVYTVQNVTSNTQFYITTVASSNSSNVIGFASNTTLLKGFATDNSVVYFAEDYTTSPNTYSGARITYNNDDNYKTEIPPTTVPGNFASVVFTSGALAKYPGSFTTNKSFASEFEIRMQDDLLYQPFAYQTNTEIDISKFYDIVISLVHPAGQRLFNNRTINNTIDVSANVSDLEAKVTKINFEAYDSTRASDVSSLLLTKGFGSVGEEDSATPSDALSINSSLDTIQDLLDGITDNIINNFATTVGDTTDNSDNTTLNVNVVVSDTMEDVPFSNLIFTINTTINDTADSTDSGIFDFNPYTSESYFAEDYTSSITTF
jgi:hypothetical protein